MVRLYGAGRSLLRIKAEAEPAGGADAARWLGRRAHTPAARDPALLISRQIRLPMTAGLIRRAILFFKELLVQLSDEGARHIRLHELAHVRRWDDRTKLGQELAAAVLFFHPAVWGIGRRLNLDREIACDDWVVAQTGPARSDAACLARLAGLASAGTAPAPAAASERKQVFRRIEMLIHNNRSAKGSTAAGLAAILAVIAAVIFVALAEPVFVFAAPPALSRQPGPPAAPVPPAAAEQAVPPAPPLPPAPPASLGRPELQKELEPLRAEMEKLREEVRREAQQNIQAHAEEIRKLAHEIRTKAHSRIHPGADEIERLRRELEREAHSAEPDREKIRAAEVQIRAIQRESVRKAEEEIRALEEQIRRYEAKIRPAEEAIRKLEKKMRELEKRIEARVREPEQQRSEQRAPPLPEI